MRYEILSASRSGVGHMWARAWVRGLHGVSKWNRLTGEVTPYSIHEAYVGDGEWVVSSCVHDEELEGLLIGASGRRGLMPLWATRNYEELSPKWNAFIENAERIVVREMRSLANVAPSLDDTTDFDPMLWRWGSHNLWVFKSGEQELHIKSGQWTFDIAVSEELQSNDALNVIPFVQKSSSCSWFLNTPGVFLRSLAA